MPIHFNDVDVVPVIAGLSSVLIVPCNMCPAVTVAVREEKPFMQFFRSLLKSPPFEKYLRELQSRLKRTGGKNKNSGAIYITNGFIACGLPASAKSCRKI